MKDDNGNEISVGDVLKNRWGYKVVVRIGYDGKFEGKLVCKKSHPCANIPYHLNNGKDHIIVKKNEKSN